LFNKLFRGNPELFALVIDDLILMGVSVDSKGASGGSKEVGEEVD